MSEADDVARRFIALWGDYLTALAADPKMAEPLHRWLGLVAAAMPGWPAGEAGPSGPSRAPARSPADAAASAGASGERDAAVAELARRLDELEARIAALERRREGIGTDTQPRRDPRLLHGRTPGLGAGIAPPGRYRLSGAARDALGFSCRTGGAGAAARRASDILAAVPQRLGAVAGFRD